MYTTTNVASGIAAVIINAKTIDGRKVDKNGNTEKSKSSGRGLVHSNKGQDKSVDYNTPRSKQCFIMPSEDNTRYFDTLQKWGVKDNSIFKGKIIEYGDNK